MSTTAGTHPESTDPRVQDFLQDKFQNLSDLDSLDTLLESVQTQQRQLREQLTTAEITASTARTSLASHQSSLQTAIASFHSTQADIDKRLLATTSAPTAAEAAAAFSSSIEKLRRLDVARGYLALLQEVQRLTTAARGHVDRGDPSGALKPYTELKQLAIGLKKRSDENEGVAVHLVDYVQRSTDGLWDEMKKRLGEGLREVLEKVGWPKEGVVVGKAEERGFKEAVEKLLVLQGPELEEGTVEEGRERVLLPMEVLCRPLELRFRYHFEGDRPTNRVDKPEWFLSHITKLVTTYSNFLYDYVQPILQLSHNKQINSRDAVTEFITALLPILRRKIRQLLPEITEEAQLLSHFIHETIKFDATLREDFGYCPYGLPGAWKGITHEVLVIQGGFSGWLKVEKDFALARYQNILESEDAWQIDYDSVDPGDSKPTKSAMRLKDLLETVTDTYRPLISFSQRLLFLIQIQIEILDQFHDRLSNSIEAFRVLNSSIARAVQGTNKDELASLSGVGGLERLCRVYGSSAYLEEAMRDWNDDIFFLELWEDLTTRSSKASNSTQQVAGTNLNMSEIAAVTSSAVLDPANSSNTEDDDALFSETAKSYKKLRARTEAMIIEQITTTLFSDIRPYTRISHWSSSSASIGTEVGDLQVSPELETVLNTFSTFLGFLHRALSHVVVKRVYRGLSAKLEQFFHDQIIMRNQFSQCGGRQLKRDVMEIWRVAGNAGGVGELVAEDAWGIRGRNVLMVLGMEQEVLRGLVKDVTTMGGEDARKAVEKRGVEMGVGEVRSVGGRRIDAWAT